MWKAMFAGAIALAVAGSSLVSAETIRRNATPGFRPAARAGSAGFVLTSARIARIKSVLRLTAEQERHWPPVEAALRAIMRHQVRAESGGDDAVHPVAGAVDAGLLRRLSSVAMPLIMSLGDDQKRNAFAVARSMGLAEVAASF